MNKISYIVVTPARDEEEHIGVLIDSMASQTIKPLAWVIVDDGSTDRTGAIADAAEAAHPWIRVVHREDRGHRQAGGGVVDAFYEGFEPFSKQPWEFVVKLDADLSFAEDYFEKCFERFGRDERLGIGGGTVSLQIRGGLEPDSKVDPPFHVRGATKIYRRACWKEIGGLIREPGWDTVDEVKANMLGWRTLTFADLPIMHQRPTGEAYGKWNDMVKGGRANYIAGYHPVFMAAKCVKRLWHPPYVRGGLALFWGYLKAFSARVPRVSDKDVIRYFQRQQMNRLLLRKSLWS